MAKKGDDTDYTLKKKRCEEYIEALEEEQKKIQVFKRDLPLCLSLVTQGNNIYIYIYFRSSIIFSGF